MKLNSQRWAWNPLVEEDNFSFVVPLVEDDMATFLLGKIVRDEKVVTILFWKLKLWGAFF